MSTSTRGIQVETITPNEKMRIHRKSLVTTITQSMMATLADRNSPCRNRIAFDWIEAIFLITANTYVQGRVYNNDRESWQWSRQQTRTRGFTQKILGAIQTNKKKHTLAYAHKLHNLCPPNITSSPRLTLTPMPWTATFARSPTDGAQQASRGNDIRGGHLSYIIKHRPTSKAA